MKKKFTKHQRDKCRESHDPKYSSDNLPPYFKNMERILCIKVKLSVLNSFPIISDQQQKPGQGFHL